MIGISSSGHEVELYGGRCVDIADSVVSIYARVSESIKSLLKNA